ncbi:acid phosphatase-domain-containing protein [Mycena galericulata]|nr:acid phosphatase-domain-containing protein [Mycena galericulata]
MYPKLVALDTDWTIFWGWLNPLTWGKGAGHHAKVEDNIEQLNYWDIRDSSNHGNKCGMYADVPRIIEDIMKNGAQLAIVSRNKSKAMCDRALWHFKVKDAHGHEKRLSDLVKYDEIYDQSKVVHFQKIKEWSHFHYSDMILYDDEAINNDVEMMLGVTFQVSRDQKGLTWANYQEGLEMWRRNKAIHSPWLGLKLDHYPKKKLIGYSGMDLDTINLLEAGSRRHDREEAARFGFAMYVTDDPVVAQYFGNWIKLTTPGFGKATTTVCAIYARDGDIWDKLPKIWVPDRQNLKTGNQNTSLFDVSWSIENRDLQVAQWGVKKPYVLFARHPNMGHHAGMTFPIPQPQRFNEMVVYPQIQEALILTVRMSDSQVNHAIQSRQHIDYLRKIKAWHITVPPDTRQDFRAHCERDP